MTVFLCVVFFVLGWLIGRYPDKVREYASNGLVRTKMAVLWARKKIRKDPPPAGPAAGS